MNRGVVLCVDDEPMVLTALRDQLRKVYGDRHLIEVAESAAEGLETLLELVSAATAPLVVISDFLMPGMRGDTFLIEVNRRYPHAVTILLSGQVDELAVARARVEGKLYGSFAKPWDMRALVNCINDGLSGAIRRVDLVDPR